MSEAPVTRMPWRPEITFGARMRMLRKQYGERMGRRLNQRQFAMEVLGMNPTTYGAWEAETNVPDHLPLIARQISEKTGVDPSWVLGTEGGPGDPSTDGLTLWYPRAA